MRSLISSLAFLLVLMGSVGEAKMPCLSLGEFRDKFQQTTSATEHEKLVLNLKNRDMKCLLEQAMVESEDINAPVLTFEDFFRNAADESRVEAFTGKNSLPALRQFEKHLFYIKDGSTEKKLYGYNFSKAASWLQGPGFFAVSLSANQKYFLGDYRQNFKNEIPLKFFQTVSGRKFSKIKNNQGSPIFGKLIDRFYQILPDVFICEALNARKNGTFHHVSYFVLHRKNQQ